MSDTHYTLCVYGNGALLASATAEAGGTCAGAPCWRAVPHSYELTDKEHGHFGVEQLQLEARAFTRHHHHREQPALVTRGGRERRPGQLRAARELPEARGHERARDSAALDHEALIQAPRRQ